MRRLLLAAMVALLSAASAEGRPKIHIAFLWHLHQPIYWPYEPVTATASAGRYGYDLLAVFLDRSGPYRGWPVDAVEAARDLPHAGAQVSFSGSLMENLDVLAAAGIGFSGWKTRWQQGSGWTTSLGNPRLDLVRFGYHHPLMALVDPGSIRRQLALHARTVTSRLGSSVVRSRGLFPPETGFSVEMIPALRAEGVEWVLVDNIHLDRTRPDYPYTPSSNLIPPNRADQRNTRGAVTWVPLRDLWAPSAVAVPWSYQPHRARYRDPATGSASEVILVPAARYEGNEDARGGFGALQYEKVFAQYEAYNTDDAHPMLVVLHHDGDNYGGGTDSYYHGNFQQFLDWVRSRPDRFEFTTVQDYLDRFPPAPDDYVHAEPGSWSGADNGDPEFLKWNGRPATDGYSPDRNSWAVLVAATNLVQTAQANQPEPPIGDVEAGTGGAMARAWHFLLNAQTSCYWYWDGAEGGTWDSHPTRAANLALDQVQGVLAGTVRDPVPPTIYPPQRTPYNPGGIEWGTEPRPSDFTVWTYIDDFSGVAEAAVRWRIDPDGQVDEDLRYDSPGWTATAMTPATEASRTDPAPRRKAARWSATIAGVRESLVDYFVEARDGQGNLGRSPVLHVWVGPSTGGGGESGPYSPARPCREDVIRFCWSRAGWLHWGIDGWKAPPASLWPEGTVAFDHASVESPLSEQAPGRWCVDVGPVRELAGQIDFVFHGRDGSWDNNGGKDWHLVLEETCLPPGDPGGTEEAEEASVPELPESTSGEQVPEQGDPGEIAEETGLPDAPPGEAGPEAVPPTETGGSFPDEGAADPGGCPCDRDAAGPDGLPGEGVRDAAAGDGSIPGGDGRTSGGSGGCSQGAGRIPGIPWLIPGILWGRARRRLRLPGPAGNADR
ncbi:hypothetical protein KBD49_15045 [Myxococcota bacterium]|nr:hypothetical protein [Myxococcota bacterium]